MNRIKKHEFEPVSLLTADNGVLDVTIVPATGQPDWLIPSNLILDIDSYAERIWTYLWQNQEVPVYHLLPREMTPESLVILEGNTDVHRIALQISGQLHTRKLRISDVKDIAAGAQDSSENTQAEVDQTTSPSAHGSATASTQTTATTALPYAFQYVSVEDETYVIPDLDIIAHHLVDLDS